MDRTNYDGLYTSYLQIYTEMAGTGKGKLGDKSSDGATRDKGAATGGGGGRSGVWTPATGAGASKRHKNNTQGDDARIKTYDNTVKADKVADRDTTPEERRANARMNKVNKKLKDNGWKGKDDDTIDKPHPDRM